MKVRTRKSSLKGRRQHGFRKKPKSHVPRGKKLKNIKIKLKARKKRRARLSRKT